MDLNLRVRVGGAVGQYSTKKWTRMVMASMAMIGSYQRRRETAKPLLDLEDTTKMTNDRRIVHVHSKATGLPDLAGDRGCANADDNNKRTTTARSSENEIENAPPPTPDTRTPTLIRTRTPTPGCNTNTRTQTQQDTGHQHQHQPRGGKKKIQEEGRGGGGD